MKGMKTTRWIKSWGALGAVLAHVPKSAVCYEDEPVVCAVTASGAVRVDADGDRCWYYRGTLIEYDNCGTDPVTGSAGAKMWRTRGGYGYPSLRSAVADIEQRRASRRARPSGY